MEVRGSPPRIEIFYNPQPDKFLCKLPQNRTEVIISHLEDKCWRAQQAGFGTIPGGRLFRDSKVGHGYYVVRGRQYAALVKASTGPDEAYEIVILARNSNDVMSMIKSFNVSNF